MEELNSNYIMTVQSKIKNTELGFCHSHEHIFIEEGQSCKVVPSLRLDDYQKSVLELELFRNCGGVSIVDAQPVGCGRMAQYLYSASVATGINIIASTGFHKLIFYPDNHWIHALDEFELTNLFKSEIEIGMYINCDTNRPSSRIASKAGIIKVASDLNGPAAEYEKLFRAAAKASSQTGVPILSHIEMGRGAFEQLDIFTQNGIAYDSIILCHLDRILDHQYILQVASAGVYLELDTIGRFKYHSDEAEVEFIIKLVEHGYEDKILLGLDSTRERMKSYGGTIGLNYIITDFIPLLKKYGLSDEIIKKFTVYNPAKALTIKNKGD